MNKPAMNDDSLAALLTHENPDVRQRGRLVATGILDTLKDWCVAERERGISPVDICESAIVVMIGEIGLLLADSLRKDAPEHIIQMAIKKYSEMATDVLTSAFETLAEGRAEQ